MRKEVQRKKFTPPQAFFFLGCNVFICSLEVSGPSRVLPTQVESPESQPETTLINSFRPLT
jgi:hypothetical protein